MYCNHDFNAPRRTTLFVCISIGIAVSKVALFHKSFQKHKEFSIGYENLLVKLLIILFKLLNILKLLIVFNIKKIALTTSFILLKNHCKYYIV